MPEPVMIFEAVAGQAVPIPEFDPEGARRVPDGRRFLSLSDAARQFRKSESALREVWTACWGQYLPGDEASIDAGATPEIAAMNSAATQIAAPGDVPASTPIKLRLLHRFIYPQLNDEQFSAFLEICKNRRLNPYCRHLYPKPRWDEQSQSAGIVVITTIDGLRTLAARTGRFAGYEGPHWCGPDGAWREVYQDPAAPVAARFGVLVTGNPRPFWAIAYFDEYLPRANGDGVPEYWEKMPRGAIAKCAEALSFRRAFPEDLAGLYALEEMDQALRDPNYAPAGTPSAPASGGASRSDEAPATRLQLDAALRDLGLADSHERSQFVSACAVRWPQLDEQDPVEFYARVFRRAQRELRRPVQSPEPSAV